MVYVVSRWGEPTQTFVRREAAAVAAAGVAVRALSLKRPGPAGGEIPVVRLAPVGIAVGVARGLVRRPTVVARLLLTVAVRSAPRNMAAQLLAAGAGVAWAATGRVGRAHLHAHFGWVAATAAWAAAEYADRPFSVVLHAFELHRPRYHDRFTAIPLRAARAVFTIAERDRALVHDKWDVHATTLRMGVDEDWLIDDGPRDPFLVALVGSLVAKKGHDVFLRALARADRRWHAVIVGEGPERGRLERLVADLGLTGRVELAGPRGEPYVRELFRRAAVACLASVATPDGDRDGVPVSLMEAMACGAATVSTDVGAIEELVGGAGVLVPSGDVAALAVAIDDLRNPARRDAVAAAGRERIAREYLVATAARPVIALVTGR